MALLHLHVARHGDLEVDDATRETYREFARAGLVVPVGTFGDGPESASRLTREGFERKANPCLGWNF